MKTKIINKTIAEEGGYIDNLKLIDQPTNAGITQPTLDKYNAMHPGCNFPNTVKELTRKQIEQIYGEDYYDKRGIDNIRNIRIAGAIFDMGVMSNFKNVIKITQKTINQVMKCDLLIDGEMGNITINAINNIPDDLIDFFMEKLKENRLMYLRGLNTWAKYGRGWAARTNRY